MSSDQRTSKTRALLYHVHGVGGVDFSRLNVADLSRIQAVAEARALEIVPTIYLRPQTLSRLTDVLEAYSEHRAKGQLSRIKGFAVEGPLLGPDGGIPHSSRWYPTPSQWRQMARLGPKGLRYIVAAPDAAALDEPIGPGMTFADLLDLLYENGVRVALGHFHHEHPNLSADRITEVLSYLHSSYESSPYLVLTDHLYNDMPRSFRHSWRGRDAQRDRERELRAFLAHEWERGRLHELLGPVPARLLNAAIDGLLMPCLNFDGHHVDLEISRRTVDYLTVDRLIALTDHTEVAMLADEDLVLNEDTQLWHRSDGAVAAGYKDHHAHMENMRQIDIDEAGITKLFLSNPRRAIDYKVTRRVVPAD